MTDTATRPAIAGTNGQAPRAIARRRQLPGGRAVVGGFLVAASAAGVFAAWTSATGTDAPAYVVVDVDVAAGDRLDAGDLALAEIDLPAAQRAVAFDDIDVLIGATALAPMTRGQLVQSSDVANPDGAPALAQVSLQLEPGAAVGGDLRPGDEVDVIVTYTTGGAPETSTISRAARVVRVIADRERVGSTGSLVVVLAVRPEALEPIASAAAAGHVTLARVTGVER